MSAESAKKLIWIKWFPKDALDGMVELTPMEELAYRRLIDLIVCTDDQLHDDERTLAWSTKTGRDWRKIKERLIALGKIQVCDGFIRNRRATESCSESRGFIAQKSAAGGASAAKRKLLKTKGTTPTGVATDVGTDVVTGVPTSQQPTVQKPSASEPARVADSEATGPASGLWTEGLAIYIEMTGRPAAAARADIGKLLRLASGDADRLMGLLRECQEATVADAFPWLRARIKARPAGPEAAAEHDADPFGIQAFCRRLAAKGEATPTTGNDAAIGQWAAAGWVVDSLAAKVADAARLPVGWRGDWSALPRWLSTLGDANPADVITGPIARRAERADYSPPAASIAFFDTVIRPPGRRVAA